MRNVLPRATPMQKAIRRELALGQLEELGIFLTNGHFDYGNGYHGISYLNPHVILEQPYRVWQFAQDLLDQIPASLLDKVQVVAGPVTGGAIFGSALATLIDGQRHIKESRVLFAPFHLDPQGLSLRSHYQLLVHNKHVLIVDDVRNTGKTQASCFQLIESSGGSVVATGELFDRLSANVELPVPNFRVASYPLSQDLVRDRDCPQCKIRVEITRF